MIALTAWRASLQSGPHPAQIHIGFVRGVGGPLFLMLMLAQPLGAQDTDVVRGKVTDAGGHAVVGAQVAVTRAPDRLSHFALTAPDGSYTVSFSPGTGDYLVHIAAPGMNEFRKRVTATGTGNTFVVDAKLESVAATLEAVRIRARAIARLDRADTFGEQLGEAPPSGAFPASLTPSQEGDLDAVASTQPGIRPLPGGGISAHGLTADQNSATLNGMPFDASFLPRDANVEVHVGSSPYDASVGGYAGTQIAARIAPGSWLAQKTAHVSMDAPLLQLPLQSPAGRSSRFSGIDLGVGRTGEVADRLWTYRVAAQGAYRQTPSLHIGHGVGGLDAAEARSVDSALSRAGLDTHTRRGVDNEQQGRGSVLLQLDRARSQKVSISELFYAGVTLAARPGVNRLAGTTAGLSDLGVSAFNEMQRSEYFADRRALNETRLALNLTSHARRASSALPAGTVLVGSVQSDSASAYVPVTFGGARGPLGTTNMQSVVLRDEFTGMSMSGIHHFKLAAEAAFERAGLRDETNSLGTYSFSSLNDFIQGVPSRFVRSLDTRPLSGTLWRGFISLGDFWRTSDDLQLMYGVRIETDHLMPGLTLDKVTETDFDIPRGAVEQVAVSPRLGFRWVFRQRATEPGPRKRSAFGYYENTGPAFVIHGGAGAFRSTPHASVLANALFGAGVSPGSQLLTCVGPSVPRPDWTAFAADRNSIPGVCTGGYPAAQADAAPGSIFIDRRYRSPTSWRGNLGVSTQLGDWRATVDGTVSINRNQRSTRDLNFANVVRFRTSDEQRPVFTALDDILPSSGVASAIGARGDPAVGRVLAIGSDARSIDNEISIRLVPDYGVLGDGWLAISYTMSDSRVIAQGFDATTFGSPLAWESRRNALVPRHQFSVQAGVQFARGLAASFFGNLWSGLPFTPIIGSDVNGDGLVNDRAFVFAPSAAPDAGVADALAALLHDGRGDSRRCLASQLGQVAAPASCRGPWTATLNMRLDVSGETVGLSGRTHLALTLNNTLAGLDQLVHGRGHTRGWGDRTTPDPVLYEVAGFDPSAARFDYAVNSHFGKPLGNPTASPFGATLDVTIDFSEPSDLQQLRRTVNSGRPGHGGVRMTADSIAKRYSHVVLDPYAYLVFYSDSLLLTRPQLAAIRSADSVYRMRVDSVWRPLGQYLHGLPDGFNAASVTRVTNDAVDRAWDLTKQEAPRIRSILSTLQWRIAPQILRSILDPAYKPRFVLPS